jgi:hypothetical protein
MLHYLATFLHGKDLFCYSETCEIRTPKGQTKSVPISEMFSFHRAICNEKQLWDQMRCPYFTGCPHFAGLLFTGFAVFCLTDDWVGTNGSIVI